MRTPAALLLALVLLVCVSLLAPTLAHAEETVSITAGFSPDVLGAPTNVFGNATIGSTLGPVPAPITHVNVLGPAGMSLGLEGTGTCVAAELERLGPRGCPADSLAGTGGGEGIYEIGAELVREPFKLDFFLGDNRPGHVVLLILLIGSRPVSIELVFNAPVVSEPYPYGLGFSVEVPPIKVLPDASDASALSTFLTLGAKGLIYTRTVHGHREREHVKGIVLPKACPRGGFPVATQFSFEDGSTVMSKSTVPCPR